MRIPEPAQGERSKVLFPDQRRGTAGFHLIWQLRRIVDGNQGDHCSRVLRAQSTRCLYPIHDRHTDVQQDELRSQVGRQNNCFLARGCLAQRRKTRSCTDDIQSHAAKRSLVVDHEDADGCRRVRQHSTRGRDPFSGRLGTRVHSFLISRAPSSAEAHPGQPPVPTVCRRLRRHPLRCPRTARKDRRCARRWRRPRPSHPRRVPARQ